MKIVVKHKKNYGKETFYPDDDFTRKFFTAFSPPCIGAKGWSRRQIDILKSVGFEIEIIQDGINI